MPKVRLTPIRLVVRNVRRRDASGRLLHRRAGTGRDESHCYPSGWQARLRRSFEFRKRGSACYFALRDPEEKESIGVANFNVVRG